MSLAVGENRDWKPAESAGSITPLNDPLLAVRFPFVRFSTSRPPLSRPFLITRSITLSAYESRVIPYNAVSVLANSRRQANE